MSRSATGPVSPTEVLVDFAFVTCGPGTQGEDEVGGVVACIVKLESALCLVRARIKYYSGEDTRGLSHTTWSVRGVGRTGCAACRYDPVSC